jgi:transposase
MNIHPVFIGIDVSKDRLDIFDGQASSCANAADAIAPLAQRWAQTHDFVVFEATGAYDRRLRKALEAAGVTFSRVNPGQARDFARAAGFLAKTDQVDARMLAKMGEALQPRPAEPVDPARERLALLHKRRDQLVHARQQERTRLKGCDDAEIAQDLRRHLAWLDEEVGALDRRMSELIAAQPTLEAGRKLLRSIPGVGQVTALTLLALVPELGARSGKAIAALAGLAPLNRDSGLHRGRRTVGGGRKRVRDALYMAAVAATVSHSRFAQRYKHLLSDGKPPKLAIIALARQMLVTANAVLRDGRVFQP